MARSLGVSLATGMLWPPLVEQTVHGIGTVSAALAPVRTSLIIGAFAALTVLVA